MNAQQTDAALILARLVTTVQAAALDCQLLGHSRIADHLKAVEQELREAFHDAMAVPPPKKATLSP